MNALWDSLAANQAAVWFAIGFALLSIELIAFGLGSGVLLFGSLAALLTGALLWLDWIPHNWIYSVACFALASAAITAALWLPFKKLQSGASLGNDRSSDLIGYGFRLESDLGPNLESSHHFSGVPWRVLLSTETDASHLDAGSPVRVSAVNAGVFYVVPHTPKTEPLTGIGKTQ